MRKTILTFGLIAGLLAGAVAAAWWSLNAVSALIPEDERVVAIDREQVQLERAARRLALRGHDNVRLVRADLADEVGLHDLPEL